MNERADERDAGYPTVAEAGRLMQQYGCEGLIILGFDGKQVMGASYGQNHEQRKAYRAVLDSLVRLLESGGVPVP